MRVRFHPAPEVVMFFRKSARRPPDAVMRLGPGAGDWLTLEQCFSNVFISGQVGSGKTTGVGAHLALGLLAHPSRPGGLILCQKPDEADRWMRYARRARRERDVIRVTLGGSHKIDLLDYTLTARGGGPEEAALLLETIIGVAGRNRQRNTSDAYWTDSSVRQMKVPMVVLPLAGLVCGLNEVLQFVRSLPTNPEQLKDPAFVRRSYALNTLLAAAEACPDSRALDLAAEFVCDEWPNLSDKTRSIIQSMTLNTLERFLSGRFADLISGGDTTVRPEMALEDGRLIVTDLPGTVYGPPAQWAQVAIKLLFQRAAMRRDLSRPCRPVFQWCDEGANFCVPELDALFLSQARQFRCACVNIVQNFPLIYTGLGCGDAARQQAQAWLSNHATHLVAAQSDHETCGFYSAAFGEARELVFGGSTGGDGSYDLIGYMLGTWRPPVNASFNEQIRPAVPPHMFATLAPGGAAHGFEMEAYVFASGRRFDNGRTWMRSTFPQIL